MVNYCNDLQKDREANRDAKRESEKEREQWTYSWLVFLTVVTPGLCALFQTDTLLQNIRKVVFLYLLICPKQITLIQLQSKWNSAFHIHIHLEHWFSTLFLKDPNSAH